jgi:hypothetical protein
MPFRSLRTVALFSSLALGSGALLAGFTVNSRPSESSPVVDGALHDHMEAVRDNTRALLRAAAEPATQADALKAVAELQKHIVEAKNLAPDSAANIAEADRPAYLLDFRRSLAEVLKELADIELAVIGNKNDEAVKRIRENLVRMRDEAHEKFNVDG